MTVEEELREIRADVSELQGTVDVLGKLVMGRFDRVDAGVDKAASLKTAIQFAAVLIIPVLVALIGGYFTLKAGGP